MRRVCATIRVLRDDDYVAVEVNGEAEYAEPDGAAETSLTSWTSAPEEQFARETGKTPPDWLTEYRAGLLPDTFDTNMMLSAALLLEHGLPLSDAELSEAHAALARVFREEEKEW